MIQSYGKVYNLGHRDLEGLLDGIVVVQEKYDGSQVSFMWDGDGNLCVRSKSKAQYGPGTEGGPDGMFLPVIDHLLTVEPQPGFIFRGETLVKPKHNTIAYDRTPNGHVVVFDVEIPGNGGFWDITPGVVPGDSAPDLAALGVDVAQKFPGPSIDPNDGEPIWAPAEFEKPCDLTMDALTALLDMESTLGGSKIEGVVIKNYNATNRRSGRPFLAGKHVSEKFKEVHKREWKGGNPGQGDIVQGLIDSLNTEARWEKAVQHLAEAGVIEDDPRDIGPLMKEVKMDVSAEEADYITERLMKWAMPKINRGLGRGLPEWYKDRLAKQQFGGSRW